MTEPTRIAILAGGCVWSLQTLFRRFSGVVSVRVGYAGCDTPNTTHGDHQAHVEAIEIVFDSKIVSFRGLLEFFFQIHEACTIDLQRDDIGAGYRCSILYAGDEQRKVAEQTIADSPISGRWPCKLVTEVVPAGLFWEGEPEHLEHFPTDCNRHFIEPDQRPPRKGAPRGPNQVRRVVKWSSAEIARFRD
jgi:peptide-methionine (S)-S-oxide reductase